MQYSYADEERSFVKGAWLEISMNTKGSLFLSLSLSLDIYIYI